MVAVVVEDPLLVAENGAPRKTGRAHDEADVFLLAIEIGLFEGIIGVALDGGHEAARHLNAVGPFGQGVLDVGAVPYATGRDDRNIKPVLGTEEFLHAAHGLVLVVLTGAYVLHLLAQVPPGGIRVLDHDGIGKTVVGLIPFLGDQLRCTHRGYDGDEGDVGRVRGEPGEGQGKAGAADKHLRPRLDRSHHEFLVIGEGDHHVDADDAVRGDLVGLADLVLQRLRVALEVVFAVEKLAIQGYPGGRHQAHTTALRDVTGQRAR